MPIDNIIKVNYILIMLIQKYRNKINIFFLHKLVAKFEAIFNNNLFSFVPHKKHLPTGQKAI